MVIIDMWTIQTGVAVSLLVEFLDDYKHRRGFSQNELAENIGVSKSTMSKIMHGKQATITIDFLMRVERATGADAGDLACLAMGRPVMLEPSIDVLLDRIARLSGDNPVFVDVLMLVMRHANHPAKLAALVELLQ